MSGVPLRLTSRMPRFTEAKWLGEGTLEQLLAFVRIECQPDRRKQGLFLCGLCRLAGDHLPKPIRQRAAEQEERLVAGPVPEWPHYELAAALLNWAMSDSRNPAAWIHQVYMCLGDAAAYGRSLFFTLDPSEDTAVRRLLHDLFGNPFRPVKMEPAWVAHNDGLVGKMAHVIEQEGRFEDLPILADALEDAGCAEPEILDHCRSGGQHFPGCWALDRLRFAGS